MIETGLRLEKTSTVGVNIARFTYIEPALQSPTCMSYSINWINSELIYEGEQLLCTHIP